MQISFELPDSFLSVDDTQNYKGTPVTVLRIMGQEALFYTGRGEVIGMSNADWEDIFKRRIAIFLGKMLLSESTGIAMDWQEDNPTGRELRDNSEDIIHYVRED